MAELAQQLKEKFNNLAQRVTSFKFVTDKQKIIGNEDGAEDKQSSQDVQERDLTIDGPTVPTPPRGPPGKSN